MRSNLIARRYAQAYMEFAEPKIGLPRCIADIKALTEAIRENPDLSDFLCAPEISSLDKAALLARVFTQVLADETLTLVKFLIEKNRIDMLSSVLEHIRVLYANGSAVDVILRTTFPLDLPLIEAIKVRMEGLTRKKVNLFLELEPDLLGGVQILMGNTIIDGSVRNRLGQLKKQLLQAKVTA